MSRTGAADNGFQPSRTGATGNSSYDRGGPGRFRPTPNKTGGTPPTPPTPTDNSDRKFKAKRINEQIKCFYALANTLGAAVIGAAYVLPVIKNDCGPNELDRPGWVLIGLVLHICSQLAIRYGTQKEE